MTAWIEKYVFVNLKVHFKSFYEFPLLNPVHCELLEKKHSVLQKYS